jgi:hypothetical protein
MFSFDSPWPAKSGTAIGNWIITVNLTRAQSKNSVTESVQTTFTAESRNRYLLA